MVGALAGIALAPGWATSAGADRFDPNRDAASDVQQALQLARSQGKLVLVDVGGEWCSWCHIFDRFVATHVQVQQALGERYVLVKVNYSPQQRNAQLLSRFPKAKGYPHFYVLDSSGNVLASQASAELEGDKDYDETKVLAFLARQQARP